MEVAADARIAAVEVVGVVVGGVVVAALVVVVGVVVRVIRVGVLVVVPLAYRGRGERRLPPGPLAGALDNAACEFGSSREELLLALVDEDEREDFERRYGEDPRSLTELGPAILGL